MGVNEGGEYEDIDTCIPYQLISCKHSKEGNIETCNNIKKFTERLGNRCPNRCVKKGDFNKKYYADHWYRITEYDEPIETRSKKIQQEIIQNGSVTASFLVYSDFKDFWKINGKDSIYEVTNGSTIEGGHAVRVIGWDYRVIDNKRKFYWIALNSWNEEWGD